MRGLRHHAQTRYLAPKVVVGCEDDPEKPRRCRVEVTGLDPGCFLTITPGDKRIVGQDFEVFGMSREPRGSIGEGAEKLWIHDTVYWSDREVVRGEAAAIEEGVSFLRRCLGRPPPHGEDVQMRRLRRAVERMP